MTDNDSPLPVILTDTPYALSIWNKTQEITLANRVNRLQCVFTDALFTYNGTNTVAWDQEIRIYFHDSANDLYIYNTIASGNIATSGDYHVLYVQRNQTSGNVVTMQSSLWSDFERSTDLANQSGDVVIIGMTDATRFYPVGFGGGGSHTLDSHDNVVITSVADKEMIMWNNSSSKWINQTFAEWAPSHTGLVDKGTTSHGDIDSHIGGSNPHTGSAPSAHSHADSEVADDLTLIYTANKTIKLNDNAANTTLTILNDDGVFKANLDVENNIVVGGTVDGVDLGGHVAASNPHSGSAPSAHSHADSEVADDLTLIYTASKTIKLNDNIANTTLTILNDDSTFKANLDVENNIVVGGTVDGVDLGGHVAASNPHSGSQADLTFGISDTNAVKINSTDVTSGYFARFTASGLDGRSTTEVLGDIGASASAHGHSYIPLSGTSSLTGDIIATDETKDLGSATKRFAEIHSIDNYVGDLIWKETHDYRTGLPFKRGEVLALVVTGFTKDGQTITVPVKLDDYLVDEIRRKKY